MSATDIGVSALDASMADLEEAGGKVELSPEKSGDARDTSSGWRPSFPVSSASSRGALAVPQQASLVLNPLSKLFRTW